MLRGIDVYDGQGDIDFDAAFAAGWTFAIFKATQGTRNVQSTFARNRQAAPAAGLGPIGIYHFAQDGDPVAQADHYCDVVGSLGPDEFAALDLEYNPTYFTLPESEWADFSARWYARVAMRLGREVVPGPNYMSNDPATRMPASMGTRPLWVAGYGANNGAIPPWGTGYEQQYNGPFEHSWNVGPWSTWTIWQYSSVGRVPGIGNGRANVDVNIAPDDLRARLGLATTPPDPPKPKESRKMYTLFNWGGGVWAWIGGDPMPLHTQAQVQSYLTRPEGVIAIGDIDDDQFAAMAPTWTKQHPRPGVTTLAAPVA